MSTLLPATVKLQHTGNIPSFPGEEVEHFIKESNEFVRQIYRIIDRSSIFIIGKKVCLMRGILFSVL